MYISQYIFKIIYSLITILLLALVFYNIFYNLADFPIYSWDEARHGVSAYEMLKKGNFIVNTYIEKIDYWNLKPPLSFLLTMAGYKLAGFNTLGLRVFSAISALLTIIVIFIFVMKKHGILASFITALSLVTSSQFLINHSARTADADSLFVFLFTASILSLLLSEQSNKWLYVSALSFSLAFLTKSWHAGNIFIIICVYLLFTGAYKQLNNNNWLLLFSYMTGPIVIWGMIRFQYDGIAFFKNMIAYDLFKRSATTIEGHIGSNLYYFEVLWKFSKLWLIFLAILALTYVLKNASRIKPRVNPYLFGLFLWLIIPFILYSLAETKIRWYILPVYPVLSIFIGVLSAGMIRNSRAGVKLALLAAILFISTSYEKQISTYIRHPIPKYHLGLVQNIQKVKEVRGYNLYIYRHTKNVWAQNTVLAAELYGDLKVREGNFTAFLKNDRALLLLKKTRTTKKLIKEQHLKVVTSNNWGVIVRKTKL
jgi:4-amino-4-deoxy-L-arabinose transferase-like glycosyltransferase